MQNYKKKDMPVHLPYKLGDIIEFRVKAEHPQNVELIDFWGNTTYVTGLKGQVKKGQVVKCRITAFKNNRPIVEPVGLVKESGARWSVTKEEVLSLMTDKEKTVLTGFVSLLLSESEPVAFESAVHKWITHLAQQKAALGSLRQAVSGLLEDTDFLFRCKAEERKCFTERITLVIELVGYYIKADELIQQQGEESEGQRFVEEVFRKLSTSGYIYHPRKNIYLLICLFTLQPALMHANIKELFNIIRKREVTDWQQESYYRLLIKVLELYVAETDAAIDRQLDQTVPVQNILQALSLIILLDNGQDEEATARIAQARLLRYASYLNHTDEKKLIDMAWGNLTGRTDKPAYTLAMTADSSMLTAVLANNRLQIDNGFDVQPLSFLQRNVRFSILPGGAMTFRPVDVGKNGKPVLPTGLLPWHNIQVVLNDSLKTEAPDGCDNIFRFMQMWKEVELALFYPEPEKKRLPVTVRKTVAEPGDKVNIYITHKDDNEKYLFHCRMVGSEEGKGTISVYPDIVGYKPNAGIESFLSEKGRPLILPAVIKDVDEEGNYIFSCKEQVTQLQADYVSFDMHMICSIGSYSNELRRYSAVSKEGFSVSIPYQPERMDRLQPFQLVEISNVSPLIMSGPYLDGEYICDRADEVFDIQDAFHELMLTLSDGTEYIDLSVQKEKEAAAGDSGQLTSGQVLEMMRLVDRKAVYETDYIRSFNYLAVARLLATLLGNEERIRFYQGRMDLLVMLHDFAVNDRVDEEKLQQLEKDNGELFRNNVQMYRRFYQLKLVSSINNHEKNEVLLKTYMFDNDKGLRDLASLVLAHNLLEEQGLYAQAADTHAYIKQQLRLKTKDTTLKHYGVENTVTEFKTSLVYPADNGMVANPDLQMQVILRVVASMLNSQGGTLYIGVNDCGYGVGVDEDLRYTEFNGDRDKYIRYITDAVRNRFGKVPAMNISVCFDADNKVPVCIIQIAAYEKGVSLDGKWPVRKNSQTIDLTEDEFRQVYGQLKKKETVVTETVPVEEPETAVAEEEIKVKTKIQTRQIPTAVFRYRDMDLSMRYDMIGYVNLKDDGVYSYSDWQMGGTSLSQPVFPEDDTFVVIYADGYINRVSVEDIVEKKQNKDYIGVKGAEIAFAALAAEDDYIYLRYKVKNRSYVRVLPLQDFEEMTMNVKGTSFTVDPVSEFEEAEIIPAKVAERMRLNKAGAGNGYSADHKDGKYIIKMVQKELKP